jgi:hypothetical protein
MTPEEVGSVFGQFQDCSEVECDPDTGKLLSRLADTACFGTRGGLRVCAPDCAPIVPGCCCGLENWREWLRFLEKGEAPFLGHDPTPCVEDRGEEIRVWADVMRTCHISFRRTELTDALRQVHQDLRDFLGVAQAWAEDRGVPDPRALVEKVDRCLAINYDHPLYMECP